MMRAHLNQPVPMPEQCRVWHPDRGPDHLLGNNLGENGLRGGTSNVLNFAINP